MLNYISVVLVKTQLSMGFIESILPSGFKGAAGGGQATLTNLIKNGLILLMVIVVLVGILYAILAGAKFIQSQGDSGQIEEAQEAIKYAVFGVAIAFIGVIAVVIIGAIFAEDGEISDALDCFLEPGLTDCN